jgi:peptidoglycan hydrolase-like protein with peptidoglycan-binding domain
MHEGPTLREQLHRRHRKVQAAAGMRMLARGHRRFHWLILAATFVTAYVATPVQAQIPGYLLDGSGKQVVALGNLSPGPCSRAFLSGRVVKREFDAKGLLPTGLTIESSSGERSFINIDVNALTTLQLSMVAREWIVSGLQTLLHEGREVALSVKLCGAAGRVAYLDAVSSPSSPPSSPGPPVAMGPSFDCGTKAVSEQPLAQMICASRELAYRELSYVIAYQALKEASSPDQRKTMVAEANALVVAINDRCNLPTNGALRRSPTEQEVGCIGALFQQERAALIERTAGVTRDEAVLGPVDTFKIQTALQAQAYLSRSDTVDGVFGPVTRKAISAWQRDNGIRETGFGSKALIDQLAAVASRGQVAPATPPSPAPPAASSEPRDRSSAIDRSGKTSAIRLTLGEGPDLRPQDVFEKVSGAVYVVQTQDSLGSAVAISERELLTNCHVVGSNAFVSLEREGVQLRAAVVSANADADRCVLSVGTAAEPLPKWVRIRPYADVKVGERAFTVGAPQGLELSLAEGIISSKRAVDAGRLFQTSAPISKGSSGGGLFDAHGNLLGITTFMLKDAQNLNFAIAAEEYAK